MPRSRKDNCQNTVVRQLLQMGAIVEVQSSKAVGYDLIVSMYGVLALVELKNKPSDKLSDNEARMRQKFDRHYIVATSAIDIQSILSAMAVRF